MPKKPHVRELLHSQLVKGSETKLKSARQSFSHIFRSLWKSFSSKNAVLVVSEVLRLFLNILILDNKNSHSAKVSV